MAIKNFIDSVRYEAVADFRNSIDLTTSSMYGKVDNNGEIVIPNYTQMSNFKNKQFKMFNFIHDAFAVFEEDMNFRPVQGKGAVGSTLFPIEATLAAIDVTSVYQRYLDNSYRLFIKTVLGTEDEKKIINIHGLIDYYMDNLRVNVQTSPVTLTKFVKSNLSFVSPCVNGLMVELLKDGKQFFNRNRNFISEVWFENYLNSAAKAGFLVDRRIPWRLVANLNSEKMQVHMQKYGLTKENFFDAFYIKTSSLDIDMLKTFFLLAYKRLIGQSDLSEATNLYSTYPVRVDECDKTISRVIKKQTIDDEQYYSSFFNDFFWVKKYMEIRLFEENIFFSKNLREKLIFDTHHVYISSKDKGLDATAEAARYVNLFLEKNG
tara:strand:- start:273 stop:1400 length:1128 start_codon:yes stop_codon:yes gene_type:complete